MKLTNQNSYGKGVYIRAIYLRSIFITLCMITVGTNWLIPLAKKIKGRWVRWD